VTAPGANLHYSWTIGSSALNLSTGVSAGGSSVTATVGPLTYNFTASGTANQTTVYLLDSADGGNLINPALVLFEEEDESNVYQAVIVQTGGAGTSDNGIGVSDVDFTWNNNLDMDGSGYGSGLQSETDDDVYLMMDQWGTLVSIDQSTSDQYTATISYPDSQVVAMIYADAPASGTSGSTTTLGNVKVMDTELATSGVETKNLVVVGGSCVNTAAMSLVQASGNGCGPQWTAASGAGANEWVIETFANPWSSSKVATLVAGWEQGDTANAATYLTTQTDVSTNVGDKWQGSTESAATLVSSTA
jgi:hypothetical protein